MAPTWLKAPSLPQPRIVTVRMRRLNLYAHFNGLEQKIGLDVQIILGVDRDLVGHL
jgi:hypothetical protein